MGLLTNYLEVIVPSFNLSSTVLEWNKIIPKKIRRDFSQQNFWSAKLTAISTGTANTIFCTPKTCCLSIMNKKATFQVLMTKYLQSFEFKFQKGQILNLFYFFLHGVIVQIWRNKWTKFHVAWPCRNSFKGIYWKGLKMQLNSWFADVLVCKIDILKKIQNC